MVLSSHFYHQRPFYTWTTRRLANRKETEIGDSCQRRRTPLMRKSQDLHAFLTQDSKSWTQRVAWYERGVLSEGVSSVTSWFSTLSAKRRSLVDVVHVGRYTSRSATVHRYGRLHQQTQIKAGKAHRRGGCFAKARRSHCEGVRRLCRCLELLATQEDKALKVFTSAKGVWWKRLSDLYAALIPTQREASDVMRSEFLDSLEEVNALCGALVAALAARKRVVDHYNRVTASIERIESKLSTMGVPEPGPKREEKQKIELAASDLRIERTQRANVTERCCANMEHELIWFHTEMAAVLGQALKARRRTRSGGGEVVATSG